jgi:hypothetical protein
MAVSLGGRGRLGAGVISLSDIAEADSRPLAGHVLYEVTWREVPSRRPRT